MLPGENLICSKAKVQPLIRAGVAEKENKNHRRMRKGWEAEIGRGEDL